MRYFVMFVTAVCTLFLLKSVVPYQIKPRIGQSNISIVFVCVSSAENVYYRAVSVAHWQLGFDCRSSESAEGWISVTSH